MALHPDIALFFRSQDQNGIDSTIAFGPASESLLGVSSPAPSSSSRRSKLPRRAILGGNGRAGLGQAAGATRTPAA
ncbi:hypothetical protein, partial [Bradyrhizobium sp.]|uniref:hypothetical protein n=1 Tax=Bradyrhizobium sp. TaxID=376 RepID=UPI0027370501